MAGSTKALLEERKKVLSPCIHSYLKSKGGMENVFNSEEMKKIREIKINKELHRMEEENRLLMKRLDFLIEDKARLEKYLTANPTYLSVLINDAIVKYCNSN